MGTLSKAKEQALELKSRYEKFIRAAFFALGFGFDLITLGRIDSLVTILIQATYLLIIGVLLYLIVLVRNEVVSFEGRWARLWKHSDEVLHFAFGALLSAYSLFYFKSASLATSLLFMFLLALLLVLNESPRLKKMGPQFKSALYALCVISYWSYLVPIIIRHTGYLSLSLSVIVSCLCFIGLHKLLEKKGVPRKKALRSVSLPAGGVIATFVILFFLQAIPPVPLSIQYMGIYHSVVKVRDQNLYQLGYKRPFWKFWQNGSQSIKVKSGQSIYCFARIFSPTSFDDKVVFHWMYSHPKWGWQSMDKIPIKISGGRDEGFRAFVGKAKHQPGNWIVKVETTDGREIGRLSLDITHSENEVIPTEFDHF